MEELSGISRKNTGGDMKCPFCKKRVVKSSSNWLIDEPICDKCYIDYRDESKKAQSHVDYRWLAIINREEDDER